MKVVVGLDLNLGGYDWLLARAIAFTTRAGGTLDLLFVGSADKLPQLEALLQGVPEAIRGEARIAQGDPEEVLVGITAKVDAIVVGPREPTGLERLFQSAMAVRVLRRTRCPVFVPRTDRPWTGPVRMIVGVDLESDKLDFVLREATRLALHMNGRIDLVHAVPGMMTSARRPELNAVLEREWQTTQKKKQERVEAFLDLIDARVRGTGSVVAGEAVDVLLAASKSYDLALVGNRDHTGIERLLLGGVARVVVVRAACDVLVLPTEGNVD